MKLGILSESSADEAGIHILAEGILDQPIELTERKPRARGWQAALRLLSLVAKELQYGSEAEGLICVIDTNRSPLHFPEHEPTRAMKQGCRLCAMSVTVTRLRAEIRPVAGKPPFKLAIGAATPCIEAWYLCGLDGRVGETSWGRSIEEKSSPYTARELKQLVYGVETPSIRLETDRAREESRRVVGAGLIPELEGRFPQGFGLLKRDLEAW